MVGHYAKGEGGTTPTIRKGMVIAMTNLNERHHAFISATFFRELRDGGYDNYREAFLLATRRYAEQRGNRMAQRAIRDGRALDYAAYRWYGEWAHTPEYLASFEGDKTETVPDGDNNTYKVTHCPWSEQYLDMGLLDGAEAYCSVLDISIARGFNPALTFLVPKTMHRDGDYCIQSQVDGKIGQEAAWGPKKADNVRDFNYHCGHVYWTFGKTIRAIYGARGEALAAKVLVIFGREYGSQATEILSSFADTEFEYI